MLAEGEGDALFCSKTEEDVKSCEKTNERCLKITYYENEEKNDTDLYFFGGIFKEALQIRDDKSIVLYFIFFPSNNADFILALRKHIYPGASSHTSRPISPSSIYAASRNRTRSSSILQRMDTMATGHGTPPQTRSSCLAVEALLGGRGSLAWRP